MLPGIASETNIQTVIVMIRLSLLQSGSKASHHLVYWNIHNSSPKFYRGQEVRKFDVIVDCRSTVFSFQIADI